jgi:ubiquinone/menaquinone biosynthesis C-methylase UbiE
MVRQHNVRPHASSPPLEERLRDYATTYDGLASEYHAARFLDRPGRYDFHETQVLITDLLATFPTGQGPHGYALDVATGTGKISLFVAQTGRTVVAVDAAPGMLRECRTRAQAEKLEEKLLLTTASATQLPYRDAVFDCVFSFRFLHLFPYEAYPALLREMARVVKPGGYLIVEMKNRRYGGIIPFLKDSWRAHHGETTFSSYVTGTQLPALARQVGRIQLASTWGFLLPRGWKFLEYPRLARVARYLARGPLQSVSAHFVAIYHKE